MLFSQLLSFLSVSIVTQNMLHGGAITAQLVQRVIQAKVSGAVYK